KDKAAVLLQRTQAYAAYVQGGLESTIPPKYYMTHFDDIDEEAADEILDAASQAHEDQDTMTMPPMMGGRETAAPPGTQDHADQQAKQEQFQQTLDLKKQQGAAGPGGGIGGGGDNSGPP